LLVTVLFYNRERETEREREREREERKREKIKEDILDSYIIKFIK